MTPPSAVRRNWAGGAWGESEQDLLAPEEPLQILLDGEPLGVLMRSPGNDVELALGLLRSERLVSGPADVAEVLISAESGETGPGVRADLLDLNTVDVRLVTPAPRRPARALPSTSACGICGAATLADLAVELDPLPAGFRVEPDRLLEMAGRLRSAQPAFELTGGIHAAGLFDAEGALSILREDIGRHNAVDKVVGRALLDGRLPASGSVLVVSGRGGYEIAQKAIAARIPVLAAVGAPSSLAVAAARRFELTLVGFLRDGRFNVYSAPERLGAGVVDPLIE